MARKIKAFWKRMISHLKTNWGIDDYPLYYKKQTSKIGQQYVGELKPWVAHIINWGMMCGFGDTKKAAYEDLKNNFRNYLERNRPPRPGTNVPVLFADNSKVRQVEDVCPDFFEKILKLNYYECFRSDESSLADFGKDDEETLQMINTTYGLSMTDLGDGNLARLFAIIKNQAK